ncbi:hypothetical protein CN220_01535 [Sinorhizobium meliloti]|nr:hypothetical protein CN220_00130 [Sinorhizobium meliloti]RVG76271.1 hypothetical protein CN220_01535 [Sinorhizobium meliloti]
MRCHRPLQSYRSGYINSSHCRRYVRDVSDTYIDGDVNGDRKADFAIHLDDAVTLEKGYFVR